VWYICSGLTLLVGRQEWHPACKKYGGWWRWVLVTSPDGVVPIRVVGVSASVNLPLHHKVQKFSSGTGSPGWSRKKGCRMVVVWWWWWYICNTTQWPVVCHLAIHLSHVFLYLNGLLHHHPISTTWYPKNLCFLKQKLTIDESPVSHPAC